MRKSGVTGGARCPGGHRPRVDDTASLHPSAQVIGNVRIGASVFVGPVAVIRADEPDRNGKVLPIAIGERCNVQDGAVLHALGGTGITVAPGTSISHGAVVHGPCRCGANCFVGFRAVVFDAVIGAGVFIGSGAVVQHVKLRSSTLVPPASVILSQKDADRLGKVGLRGRRFMRRVERTNTLLAKGYLRLAGQSE